MQGTSVPSLVWEGPTCCGAAKPVCHKYWACVLQIVEPMCPRAHCWAPLQQEKPPQWEAWAPQLESSPGLPQTEKAHVQQWRPRQLKVNNYFFKKRLENHNETWLSPQQWENDNQQNCNFSWSHWRAKFAQQRGNINSSSSQKRWDRTISILTEHRRNMWLLQDCMWRNPPEIPKGWMQWFWMTRFPR